jgi:hypothetical protein
MTTEWIAGSGGAPRAAQSRLSVELTTRSLVTSHAGLRHGTVSPAEGVRNYPSLAVWPRQTSPHAFCHQEVAMSVIPKYTSLLALGLSACLAMPAAIAQEAAEPSLNIQLNDQNQPAAQQAPQGQVPTSDFVELAPRLIETVVNITATMSAPAPNRPAAARRFLRAPRSRISSVTSSVTRIATAAKAPRPNGGARPSAPASSSMRRGTSSPTTTWSRTPPASP